MINFSLYKNKCRGEQSRPSVMAPLNPMSPGTWAALSSPLISSWDMNSASGSQSVYRAPVNQRRKYRKQKHFLRSTHSNLCLCLLGQHYMDTADAGKGVLFSWIQDALNEIRALVVKEKEKMDFGWTNWTSE